MRVYLLTFDPKRTRKPTVPPTCSPNVDAIRSAAARAASRRGSSTRIFLPFAHGSSSSTSGTRVVLPAPGGATRTAALLPSSAAVSSTRTVSMGREVSKVRILWASSPAKASDLVIRSGDFIAKLAFTGCTAFAGHSNRYEFHKTSRARPSDAYVYEAVAGNFLWPINIAQIDEHRLCHDSL